MEKTNAQRFIHAYNTIDQALRVLYNYKRSMSFSDIVRRSVPVNYVVRKYEDKLVDYGRLRNAIIHKSNEEFIIAEPHGDVVLDLENIAKLISTPPKALEVLQPTEVITAKATEKLANVIKLMSKTHFSNIPVYDDGQLVGVASGRKIVEGLGKLLNSSDICEALENTNIGDIIKEKNPMYSYFEVAKASISVEEVLQMFYKNRKLQIIIVTKTGDPKEKPINIISTGDLIELNKVFENYEI